MAELPVSIRTSPLHVPPVPSPHIMSQPSVRATTPDDVLARCVRVHRMPGAVSLHYLDQSGLPVEVWTILEERYSEAKLHQWEDYVLTQELGAKQGITSPGILMLVR